MNLSESNTVWVKFGKIKRLSFVGKEFVCIGSGCHMLCINLLSNEEFLYHADGKKAGEGVSTFVGHKNLSIFALAEKRRYPRIFIKTCPAFSTITVLEKDANEDYINMAFSEGDYLICLTDMPSFKVVVWNWRRRQKIIASGTNIYSQYQLVKCNLGNPVCFAQVQTGSTNLNLWEMSLCGKKCILTPHRIAPLNDSGVYSDILWTTEGTLFVLDLLGNAYTLTTDYNLIRVIEWEGKGTAVTSFTWYKAGLTIAGPDGNIKHFKKSGSWTCDWSVTPPMPLKRTTSNQRDLLVGVSADGELMQYDFAENNFKYIKQYQSKFNDICLIYPAGEYFVTLQHNREVTAWEVATGSMIDIKTLKGEALVIKGNPEYPYVGVGYTHGVLELISLYDPTCITVMTSFNLSKNPLNSIYYTTVGKMIVAADTNSGEFFIIEGIPGSQMQIVATLQTNHQICDYMLIASRICMRLFVIYVTSDLYIAGNRIARYCIVRNKPHPEVKEYRLETATQMYSRIYATTKINRDRVFYAVPLTTKYIHEITTRRGDPLARVTSIVHTEHQMKKIILHKDKDHIITYAYDGLVIVRTIDFTKKIAVIMPHYRNYGGVLKAYVDPYAKYVVSLGRDNTLVCTTIAKTDIDTQKQQEIREMLASTRFSLMFQRPTIGFAPTGELEGKTWSEVEKINQEELEKQHCREERESILEEFKSIQSEVQKLLTANLEGPENEKLDIQEFNLDVELQAQEIKKSQEECERTKVYLEALIAAQDKVSKWLKEFCWDPMSVPGKVICAIYANFVVTNYVLIQPETELIEFLQYIEQYRNLEKKMAKDDIFEPWIPKTERELSLQLAQEPKMPEDKIVKNYLELLDEQEHIEEQIDTDTDTAFKGSVSHLFTDLHPGHYTQQQVQSFLQTEFQTKLCLWEAYKVKQVFNKQFDEVMSQKVREMNLVCERNARLRHIISELNYFSSEKINILIDDPPWLPVENPESVLHVSNKEVGVTPYISPSEQAMLDAKAAEDERIRLLLLADDFRERALMAMMNGVLEVRWEDELKKDVPKPKCMLEKQPEEYNEEDLRAVRDYEKDVAFLNSERERYKKLLETEYVKISIVLKESMRKFNKRLSELLQSKIKADSAIRQENLRISRMRLMNKKRMQINEKERGVLRAITENHREVDMVQKQIILLQKIVHELRANLDVLQTKEKLLEKAFKKEFVDASPVVQEQSIKLYKRRPKVNIRSLTSITLTQEVAKCLMTQEIPLILTQECLEFLKSLDALDMYVNVPPAVDEHTYGIICKHRRLKIESEVKIKAANMEIAEAENTLSTFHKLLHQKKEKGQTLLLDLEQVRNDRVQQAHDMEIQLIVKQGLVEIPTTGCLSDFDDAILVSRKDVETINKIIVRGGKRKIKAMKETMNFRRGIVTMEWEHSRLKMQIADLENYIQEIDSIKVTKEIQTYLKFKARGDSPDKGISFEEELDMVKASYERIILEKKNKVKELQQKINSIKKENHLLDEQIASINIDVCEYQLERDIEVEKREKDILKIRMATLLKRSKLVNQIQKNHNDILMLQTELELLRLKTYPTLSYQIL